MEGSFCHCAAVQGLLCARMIMIRQSICLVQSVTTRARWHGHCVMAEALPVSLCHDSVRNAGQPSTDLLLSVQRPCSVDHVPCGARANGCPPTVYHTRTACFRGRRWALVPQLSCASVLYVRRPAARVIMRRGNSAIKQPRVPTHHRHGHLPTHTNASVRMPEY